MVWDSVVPFGHKQLISFHKMACSSYGILFFFLILFRYTVLFQGIFCFICNKIVHSDISGRVTTTDT